MGKPKIYTRKHVETLIRREMKAGFSRGPLAIDLLNLPKIGQAGHAANLRGEGAEGIAAAVRAAMALYCKDAS